jgi:hypothetical protein
VRPTTGPTPSAPKRLAETFVPAIHSGLERFLIAPDIVEIERREGQTLDASLRKSLLQRHEPIRVGIAEWTNQHGIDDAEERRIRADAETKGQHDDAGESDVASKRPCGVPEIPKKRAHSWSDRPGVAEVFPNPGDAAEPPARAAAGVNGS